jgi:hypothetical protein
MGNIQFHGTPKSQYRGFISALILSASLFFDLAHKIKMAITNMIAKR